MNEKGQAIMQRFYQLPDAVQSEQVNNGLKAIELLMAKATANDVNVIIQLLDKHCQLVGDKDLLEMMNQFEEELMEFRNQQLEQDDV